VNTQTRKASGKGGRRGNRIVKKRYGNGGCLNIIRRSLQRKERKHDREAQRRGHFGVGGRLMERMK